MVRMTIKTVLAAIVAALTLAGGAAAAGVQVDGGTPFEQAQVTKALAASSFDFGQLPQPVAVHIVAPGDSHLADDAAGYSTPGEVWLSSYWLDFGPAGWGFVQHEFAHEVDYMLLTDAERAALLRRFGATSWCDHSLPYTSRPCEWFASELAWAFWPGATNLQSPGYTQGLSGHLPVTTFRAALESFGLAKPTRVCRTHTVRGHWVRRSGKRVWIRRHTVRSCTLRP